jgi:hypothetical protein
MAPITISLACAVARVVPVEAGCVVPMLCATTSNGDVPAPAMSRTVSEIAELAGAVPPTVTVIDCDVLSAPVFAAYQISWSA